MHKVIATRQAKKDSEKLKQAGLLDKAKELAEIVQDNPYQTPPPYEKLSGDLSGYYSRRINIQHRFVYEELRIVLPETHRRDSINRRIATHEKHERSYRYF